MKLLRDLFMGPDNESWDLGRITAAGGFLTIVGGVATNAIQGHGVDLMALGTGFGAYAGGAGLLISLKDRALTNHAIATQQGAQP